MSEAVVKVEDLGKRYQLGVAQRYATLRESLTDFAAAPLRRLMCQRRGPGPAADELWALRHVSFEVRSGEVVGIIGRNGAGKSTLLKVLSRITQPSEGAVELTGRVGSLLEVGTGFHQELTGRENIFLNGAILGMKAADIRRRFDEIVAFAEVERFLDTPVKRYSSGMYMRLAFAVAAHLEPEILVVDEVLAVGDMAFQKKCLGKMGEVAKEGRTVLFVSHNMGAVATLCTRAILLCGGNAHADGPPQEVIARYIALGRESNGEVVWNDPQAAPGNDNVRLHAVRIVSKGAATSDVPIDEPTQIEVEFWNYRPGVRLSSSIHVLDPMGAHVLASANMHSANLGRDEWFNEPHPAGLFRATCTIPGNFLNEGIYGISAFVLTDVINVEACAQNIVSFHVHDTGAMRQEFSGAWAGVVRPRLEWGTRLLNESGKSLGPADDAGAGYDGAGPDSAGPPRSGASRMNVVILCGGQGTRLREETEYRPKPLVEVGGHPILWHIMKTYAHHGFRDFTLCLGYRGRMIKQYFLDYEAMTNDFTICLGRRQQVEYHGEHAEQDFRVTLAETGLNTMTGGRVERVERHVKGDTFMVTYGDGVADVNIRALYEFHRSHGKAATVTTVRPTSRYGIVEVGEGGAIQSFSEKPQIDGWASAGFFVLERRVFDLLSGDDCVLEREPLERLAREGELMAYRHHGFFYAMDTYREYQALNELWASGQAPWKVWD